MLGSIIKDIFRKQRAAPSNVNGVLSLASVISILEMGDAARVTGHPDPLPSAGRFAAYEIRNDPDISNNALSKLHVGGKEAKPGWKIMNVQPGDSVDYVGDIRDLGEFPDAAFDIVYASHVLEHVSQLDMGATLSGLYRILTPNGKLMISVPDLEVLCKLFIHPELNKASRFQVMRMMFGGQTDQFDFHKIGLSYDILAAYLRAANFQFAKRVDQFGIFNDTSALAFYNVPISLNLVAFKASGQT